MFKAHYRKIFFILSIVGSLSFSLKLQAKNSAIRSAMTFTWKNPTECQIDNILALILFAENEYKDLKEFWKLSSLCHPQLNSQLQRDAHSLKKIIIMEVKRSLGIVRKERPMELQLALEEKKFQEYLIDQIAEIYSDYTRRKISTISGHLIPEIIIHHLDQQRYSQYGRRDLRRLIEFHSYSDASGKTYEGNQWVYTSKTSILKLHNKLGLVTRGTWGFEGLPQYEPSVANEDFESTLEIGLATLGSDKISTEILLIHAMYAFGKPEQYLAVQVNWTPFENSDLEINLGTRSSEEEHIIYLFASYSFESHPLEPITNWFKKQKLKRQLKRH